MTTAAPDSASGARTFLHVGCGAKRRDRTVRAFGGTGWSEVTLDIDERARPDILDSLPGLAKAPSGTFDAVYSAHNLEHLHPHEVGLALRAFHRVLKADGFAIVTCPDLQAIGEILAAGDIEQVLYVSPAGPVAPLDVLYGFRPSVAAGNTFMAHRGGFTLKSLMSAFRNADFSAVAGFRRPASYDLWVLASKVALGKEELEELRKEFLVPVG